MLILHIVLLVFEFYKKEIIVCSFLRLNFIHHFITKIHPCYVLLQLTPLCYCMSLYDYCMPNIHSPFYEFLGWVLVKFIHGSNFETS